MFEVLTEVSLLQNFMLRLGSEVGGTRQGLTLRFQSHKYYFAQLDVIQWSVVCDDESKTFDIEMFT